MHRSIGICIIISFSSTWLIDAFSKDGPLQPLRYLQEAVAFENNANINLNDIIIMMDLSGSTKKNRVNEVITNITRNWIMYQFPSYVAVGLVQIGDKPETQNMTVLEDIYQRKKIISGINHKSAGGGLTPFHGISLAEMIISGEGGLLLVISDESWHIEHDIETNEKTMLKLKEMKWKIVNIHCSKNKNSDPTFKIQILSFRNKTLAVMNEWLASNPVTMLDNIMAALSLNWGKQSDHIVTLYQRQISITQNSWSDMFVVDAVCKESGTLQIYLQNWFHYDACSYQLISPDENIEDMQYDEDLNTFWSSIINPLNGTWNITASCSDKHHMNVSLIVEEVFPIDMSKTELSNYIQLSCSACEEREVQENNTSDLCIGETWHQMDSTPLLILAAIKKNNSPLKNMEVTIFAQELTNAKSSLKETVILHDGGWGADKTDGDGIYSGYFILSKKSYPHCGDPNLPCNFLMTCIAKGIAPAYGNIQRQIKGRPFKVREVKESYPPSFIRDLEGLNSNCSSKYYPLGINLTWTATGVSLDQGAGLQVDLFFEAELENLTIDGKNHLMDNEEDKFIPILSATGPGERQVHHICMLKKKQEHHVCLSLYSHVIRSPVSNRICISFTSVVDPVIPNSPKSLHWWWILVLAIIASTFVCLCRKKIKIFCKSSFNYVFQSQSWSPEQISLNNEHDCTVAAVTSHGGNQSAIVSSGSQPCRYQAETYDTSSFL